MKKTPLTTKAMSLANIDELQRAARTLSVEQRQQILRSFTETDLHPYLQKLFQAMDPEYLVEVTHGKSEFGKDLVLVKSSPLTTDVIGVVVKCGDISGKTSGDVDALTKNVGEVVKLTAAGQKRLDEIESQVKQARLYPADLNTILNELPITKVMVVLAGKISDHASKRFRTEMKLTDPIRDLEWLTNSFTQYYPQVFFEGECVDFLLKKIQTLETAEWLTQSEKNLSEWWVEPLVATVDVPMTFDSESIEALWQNEKFPVAGLGKILREGKHVILAGDPGSGKSAAMAKFALNMLRDAHRTTTKVDGGKPNALSAKVVSDVPILVTAKEILEADSAEDLVNHYFTTLDIASRFNTSVLLVDGLDELPSVKRSDTIEKARRFAEEIKCSLVITSRKIEIIRETPKGFRKYELLPFEMGQAIQLCQKLLVGNPLLATMMDGLRKVKDQIPFTPLSLVLLLEVVNENQEVPSSVTELYDRYFDMILGRYEAKRGIEVLFEPFIKRSFLASLAYREFFCKDRLEIQAEDYQAFCAAYAEEFGYSSERLSQFHSEVDRAGILVNRETIEFKHRSFLDYFTAAWINDNSDEIDNLNDFLVDLLFGDLWDDVTFFYIGLKRRISRVMLEKIYAFPTETLAANTVKLSSGKLLQAGWNSTAQVKKFGVDESFRFAPLIKKELEGLAQGSGGRVPRIVADYMVMMMSEDSLRSGHLSVQLKELLDSLIYDEGNHDLRMLPAVLWTVEPFLSPEDLKASVDESLRLLTKSGNLAPEELAATLIVLGNLKNPDKSFFKAIRQEMKALVRRSPRAFENVVPATKNGFRTAKSTRLPGKVTKEDVGDAAPTPAGTIEVIKKAK